MQQPNPIRSALFLYVGSFLATGMGSLYWILVGRITNPDTVGQASAAFTVLTIALTIASLGVAQGLPRFLGRTVGGADYWSFRRYTRAAISVMVLSSTVVGLVLMIVYAVLEGRLSLSYAVVTVIVVSVVLASLSPIFNAGLVSLLRTDHVAANSIVGGMSRIAAGLLLVFLGFGVLGIVLGLTIMYMVLLLMSAASLQRVLSGMRDGEHEQRVHESHVTAVVAAGLPSYAPMVVSTVGTQIGTLLVFGASGASQTGLYFLSMQIYAAAMIAPGVVMTLLFPYVCANPDRDAHIMSRGVKYALVPSFPFVSLMLLYPFIPLALMGDEYILASPILQTFALSIIPIVFVDAVTKLRYARGHYRIVLYIGMLTNVPRVVLYFILTPNLGSMGASIAFLVGSFTGLCAALVSSSRLEMSMNGIVLIKMALPPLVLCALLYITGLHWLIGIPLLLALTGGAYARLGVLSRAESIGIAKAILPRQVTETIGPRMMSIVRLVYGE